MSFHQGVKNNFANLLVTNFVYLLKNLKRSLRLRLASGIAWLIFKIAKKTRARSLNNIAKAMPNLNQQQIKTIAFNSYKNIVMGLFDCFWMSELELEYDIDPETMKLLQADSGASISTMHMSCFEIVPFALQRITNKSTTLSNIPEYLDCAKKVYLDAGINCINKKEPNSFFRLLQSIRQGKVVSLHSDHYAEEVEINFFGQKTRAPGGTAMLSAYGNTPLLMSYATLQENGKYRVCVETISAEPIEAKQAAINDAMDQIYNRFEQVIHQFPEQWYWSYKRWR